MPTQPMAGRPIKLTASIVRGSRRCATCFASRGCALAAVLAPAGHARDGWLARICVRAARRRQPAGPLRGHSPERRRSPDRHRQGTACPGGACRCALVAAGTSRTGPDRSRRTGLPRPPGERRGGERHPGDRHRREHTVLGVVGTGVPAAQVHARNGGPEPTPGPRANPPRTPPSSPTSPRATARAWRRSRSGTSPTRPTKPTSRGRKNRSTTPPCCAPPTPRSSRPTRT